MIVPVVTAQVGCVGVTVGAAGAVGTALIVTEVPVEVQPLFLTVTEYTPGATPVKIPVVFV